MSAKAKKAKGKQIRDWHLNRCGGSDLSDLAQAINAQVRGWIKTTTVPSIAPSCISSHDASTSIWSGGPCRSSSD
jgi:hypothetical protein